jgi:proteasome accessory factor C
MEKASDIEQQKILKVFKLIKRLTYGSPSKASKLWADLEISKPTFYRYLELLRELNYNVEVDEASRYYISTVGSNYKSLTTQEKNYLTTLVSSAERKTKTHHSILAKLQTSEGIPSPKINKLLHRVAIIERVIGSIATKNPLTLLKYRSTSDQSLDKDRHVMPIYLDEHKLALLAYDYDEAGYRIYKLHRVGGLDTYETNEIVDFTTANTPTLDPFGFSSIEKIKIELLLTKRATTILQEEYDIAEDTITKTKDKLFPFRYKDNVSSYQGIGRFVLGMCTEVKIVKDTKFEKYIMEKLKVMTLLQ